MAKDLEPGDPFYGVEPKDGFRIKTVEDARSISLFVCAYWQGDLTSLIENDPELANVEVKEWVHPSEADRGDHVRLRDLLIAVCRYLNCGGDMATLQDCLRRMEGMGATEGLQFPGYHYSDGYICADGNWQHIFIKDGTHNAVVWQEPDIDNLGGAILPKTLEEIKAEQEEAEEDDDDWSIEGLGGVGGAGQAPDLQALPPPDDTGDEG